MVVNTCVNPTDCTFNYLPTTSSPELTSISSSIVTSGSVTLFGRDLDSSVPVVVLTNKLTGNVTVVSADSYTNTEVVFTVPSIESGSYNCKARIDPIGETNAFLLEIKSSLTGATPSSISTQGGIVKISGKNLPSFWPNPNFSVFITKSGSAVELTVLYSTPQ